jgi:sigma-E factor negative regulatory protein RseC
MIEEIATIVDTEGDTALVETQRTTTCGSCSANKACGTAVLSKVIGNRTTQVRAINTLGVMPGDKVVIGIQEQALIKGSFAVYAVPLILMFAGALLGEIFSRAQGNQHEGIVILFGLIGLLAGFSWVKRFSRRIRSDSKYQPVILRKA